MTEAILSEDGVYRYWLERALAETGITVGFIGVNPSRAEDEVPDQTDMKWRGFARRWGTRRYIAWNPFAYRATDVKVLGRTFFDPVGPDNDFYLQRFIREADLIVPCWGSRGKLPKRLHWRLDEVRAKLGAVSKPVKVFGLTASGDPMHPLMLAYDTTLVRWFP